MSDQNPPASSSPEEPASPNLPPTHTDLGQRPERRESKSRGKLLAIIAAVVVVVLVLGGLGAYFLLKSDNHKLTTPSTAGSMKRDTAREKALSTQLNQAEQQFKTQGKGGGISYVKSAVYNQTDTKRGPAGALVFLGAKLKKDQSPSKWVADRFTKQAKSNGMKVASINPGDGGGKAVCASITTPQKIVVCAWATHDTIGELVPTVAGYDAKTLSKIMVDLRKDVEKSD